MANQNKTPEEIKAAEQASKDAEAAAQAATEAQAEADRLEAEKDAAAFAATEAERAAAPLRTPDLGAQPEAPALASINLAGLIVHKPVVVPTDIPTTQAANGTVTAHFGGDPGQGDKGKGK